MIQDSQGEHNEAELKQVKEDEDNRIFLAGAWDWIKSIALAIVTVMLIHQFLFNLSPVKGKSMEPTLLENEWLLVNKISYIIGKPKMHDVVILKQPDANPPRLLVKRIIALPGDTVEIRDTTIYINGVETLEPYTDINIEDGDLGPLIVPEHHYFVMGDNRHRDESKDSRSFGTVPSNKIEGKAQFILWPVKRWEML